MNPRFFRTGPTMGESMTVVLKTGDTMVLFLSYSSTYRQSFFFMACVLLAVQTTATKTEKPEKTWLSVFCFCFNCCFFRMRIIALIVVILKLVNRLGCRRMSEDRKEGAPPPTPPPSPRLCMTIFPPLRRAQMLAGGCL